MVNRAEVIKSPRHVLDNTLFTLGNDNDVAITLVSAANSADAEVTNLIEGTSDHQGTAANSLVISNVTNDGDIQMLVSDNGDSKEFLLANGDTADLQLGHGMATATIKTASGALTLAPASGDIMVALAGSAPAPDTDRVHIWEGSAGSVDSNAVTALTIEHSDDTGIQFLTPADKVNYILFGDADANNTGLLSYNHDTNTITMKAVSNLMALSVGGGVDLQSNSAGLLNVGASGNDWTANTLALSNANAGADSTITVTNTSTTASSRAVLQALVPATDNATVDAMVVLGVSAQFYWRMGIDNSQSDRFAISANNFLGGDDVLRITTAGAITFDNSSAYDATGETNHGDADFDYVCDGCGKASIEMFDCCGKVEWHDDVLAVRESRLSPEGVQHMAKLGILEIDGPNDSDPGWIGINYQKAQNFTWAGMWQNRQRMDSQYEQLNKRLEAIGA